MKSKKKGCEACTLKDYDGPIHGAGNKQAQILVVGESPAAHELRQGIPFCGPAGQLLNKLLDDIGLPRSEVFVTNAVRCSKILKSPRNFTPTASNISCCRPYLVEEINHIKPKWILSLGNIAAKSLANLTGITDLHGSWRFLPEFQCHAFFTLHPAAILRRPELLPQLRSDFFIFKRLIKQGPELDDPPIYVARTLEQVSSLVDYLMKFNRVTFDTETNQFSWVTGKILSIAFSPNGKEGYCIPFYKQGMVPFWDDPQPVVQHLRRLASSNVGFVAHNAPFDLLFLRQIGVYIKNLVFDTIIAQHVVDENVPLSLTNLTLRYTNLGPYELEIKKYVPSKTKGSFSEIPSEVLYKYNALDAIATFRVMQALEPQLDKEGVRWLFENLAMPLMLTLVDVEERGMRVDPERLKIVSKELAERIEVKTKAIKTACGKDFNHRSPKQLSDLLFSKKGFTPFKKTKTGKPSTDKEVLERFARKDKVIAEIAELKKLEKLKSTFVDGTDGNGGIKRFLDKNSRIHSDFRVFGTTSGRLSSSRPDLQNLPRDGSTRIRWMFKPEDGWRILGVDINRAELHIAAGYAHDETLLDDLKASDFHSNTASNFGITPPGQKPTREDRMVAKALVFSLLYGSTPSGSAQKIGIPKDKAESFYEKFFSRYPKIKTWMDDQRRKIFQEGEIVNIFGRKRRFPWIKFLPRYGLTKSSQAAIAEAERQAINFLPQSTTSDVLSLVTILIHQRLKQMGLKSGIVTSLHDALYIECPEDEVKKVEEIVRDSFDFRLPKIGIKLGIELGVHNEWW